MTLASQSYANFYHIISILFHFTYLDLVLVGFATLKKKGKGYNYLRLCISHLLFFALYYIILPYYPLGYLFPDNVIFIFIDKNTSHNTDVFEMSSYFARAFQVSRVPLLASLK